MRTSVGIKDKEDKVYEYWSPTMALIPMGTSLTHNLMASPAASLRSNSKARLLGPARMGLKGSSVNVAVLVTLGGCTLTAF